MSGRRVLFYPERPAERAVITPICRASGSTLVTDPRAPCDLSSLLSKSPEEARLDYTRAAACPPESATTSSSIAVLMPVTANTPGRVSRLACDRHSQA